MNPSPKRLFLATLLLGLPLLQAAPNRNRCCGCAISDAPGLQGPCAQTTASLPADHPTFDDATSVLLRDQFAEEQMAARVYRALAETYPAIRPFQNIPRAEDRHAIALSTLVGSDTDSPMIENPTYSKLGDELIARGQRSELEALQVGAFIEERDILDLRALAARIDHVDALALVGQLEQGSYHHLNAFVRQLKARGQTYTPQLLSREDYARILSPGA